MGSTVGLTSEFIYINTSGANIATITAGDGSTTLVGAVTVAVTTSARFIIRIASATTVVLYRA
jgi:cation transporter-like permease